MDKTLKTAYNAAKKGQSYAFATIVESTLKGTPCKAGTKMVVLADGSIAGTVGGGINEKRAIDECKKAIHKRKPTLITLKNFGLPGQPICGGEMKIFIEPFAGTKHLIICGGGHIALPLSVIGKMLQFKVTVLDNRKEFASKTRFPHVDQIIKGQPARSLSKLGIDNDTYVVIITHGHEFDYQCLKKVIHSDAKYIGVISSKTKRDKFFADLKKTGISQKLLKRIKIPVGLDIGAQTPEEIALSISSEIVSEYSKGWLKSKKFEAKL